MSQLKGRVWIIGLVVVLSAVVGVGTVQAEPRCGERDRTGFCSYWIEVPGGPGGGWVPGPGSPGEGCFRGDTELPCVVDGGQWDESRLCYVAVAVPQPPPEHPIWAGRTNGTIYNCVQGNVSYPFWVPDEQPPDPEAVARRLITEIEFAPVRIGTSPRTLGEGAEFFTLVGWPNWLWVKDPNAATWGPISRSTTEAGYTISLTAVVTGVTWDMGNGDVVECGQGTRFRKREHTSRDVSPDCGYRYPQPGEYPLTVTSHWVITWSGVGKTGVIEQDLTAATTYVVKELHTVNIPNPDQ